MAQPAPRDLSQDDLAFDNLATHAATALIPLGPQADRDWLGGKAGDWLRNQRSTETTRAYAREWRAFIRWCRGRGLASLADVAMGDLLDWLNWLALGGDRGPDHPYADATIHSKIAAVHAGWRYAMMLGLVAADLPILLKGPRVPDTSPRSALTGAQVRAILAAVPRLSVLGRRDYAILLVMAHLGLRRQEVATLRWGMLGEQRGHRVATVVGKGHKARMLPMPPVVWAAITDHLERDPYRDPASELDPKSPLFYPTIPNLATGAPRAELRRRCIDPGTITRRVHHYARLAGVSVAHLDAHTFRVTAITTALAGGATLEQAQEFGGHGDPRTTKRYDKLVRGLDESAVYRIFYDQ